MNNGTSLTEPMSEAIPTNTAPETALPNDFSVAETQPPSQKAEKKAPQPNPKLAKSKPSTSKSIGFISILGIGVFGAIAALTGVILVNRLLLANGNNAKDAKDGERSKQWARAIDLVAPQEVERVVRKSVKLTDGLTIEQIKTKLTARELVSGGETFTIYKFQFPQTCGNLGCLYAIVDKKDGISIPLQLNEIPDGNLFTPIQKPNCFNVRQKNEGIENYEICKPG